ncbi:cation diffusion facilitator family transporter [Halopseudomonas laoshanensis]|uniref:Cation-efflux pump FieF n=1 Tax=Halopseudomonas laoshanensis TaxID=2268758 RepID=A0A7V7GTP1_9GAMM|nr:cation diffusion facilitator family transporter [Halopseudomonas laoshanensis]KAA0694777.1 cation diffusion facilitator family transporter [Halopseudomonas laoshanensis]WOD12321.1 cation diffusion facilitator family transporter [Pseudomonas sp. NyZ704]
MINVPPLKPAERDRLLKLATYASVAVAVLLIALKSSVYLMSGSVSLLASLIDSLMDAAASVINLFAVRYALKPADHEHRFGHGKAEALAGLAQSAFITGSAVLVLLQGIDRLLNPRPLDSAWLGIAVMLFSIAATIGLLLIQRHVIKRTGSTAIRADSLHYRSDLLLNASIIVALLLAAYGIQRADAFFGLAIALFIGYSAIQIGRDAVQILMDRELSDEVRAEALQLARSVEGVVNVHDFRSRQSGHDWFMQMHVEIPAQTPLVQAHDLGERVRARIVERFPQTDVLIHTDPV